MTQDISGTPDGEVVLCLVGLRIVNGLVAGQQLFAGATTYQWLKGAPAQPIADITNRAFRAQIARGVSSMTQLDVRVTVRAGNNYRFKIGAAATTVCTDPAGYSAYTKESTPIVADISAVPDGPINLCLLGFNITKQGIVTASQPLSTPTLYRWTKSTTSVAPPAAFHILTPSGLINTQNPTVSWETSAGATSYDVVVARDAACSRSVQGFQNVTQTSFALPSPLASGVYYTCVTAKDASTTTTPAANNGLTFTVDVTPPKAFRIKTPTGISAIRRAHGKLGGRHRRRELPPGDFQDERL